MLEGTEEVGYTITFTKSAPITLLHGKDGAKGEDGATPVIGVAKDDDGLYYWTVRVGSAVPVWLTDADGRKIPATGEEGAAGHSPVLGVADFEGALYWQLDGEWLLDGEVKVPATGAKGDKGEQGDAVFAANGVDYTSDPDNVTFTLADGVTRITLPRATAVTVGFDSYATFYASAANRELALVLPATLKEDDFTAIVATVTNENGSATDIRTRAVGAKWGVEVTEPAFEAGVVVPGSARVKLTPPADVSLSETALLRVTIVDNKGREYAVSRPVKYFDGQIVACGAGGLSAAVTAPDVTKLAVTGSIDASDFAYIRQNLTALEVLDLTMTDLETMPDRGLAFYGTPNTTLRRVALPASVATVDEAAFADCAALESIRFEGVRTIGPWAFENCAALRDVQWGDKLETVSKAAFMNCSSLVAIDIPASVQTLGRWVFQGCGNLETIVLHEGLQALSPSTFYGCGVVSLRIPSTVKELPAWTFQQCLKLERIVLHDGIRSIGEGAFQQCRSLRHITIPKGVTVIEPATFELCSNLQSVYFHDGITVIRDSAFGACTSLRLETTNVDKPYNLPASLTTLENAAFIQCTSITGVSVPPLIETLPSYLFNGCTALSGVTLPEGLREIGDWAFGSCRSLASITLPSTVSEVGHLVFHGCTALTQVYSYVTTAPTIQTDTFGNDHLEAQRYLYIPRSAQPSAYAAWAPYFGKGISNVLND